MVLGAAVLPLALLAPVAALSPAPGPRPEPVAVTASADDSGDVRPENVRPPIVGRVAWDADEDLVREPPEYTGRARAVFVHHTAHGNAYDCSDVPEMLRALQREHVRGKGWDDVGYNFLVDRCGTVYEGRAGGVSRPVHGAHTKGFNADSVGIAVIGTFGTGARVPDRAVEAVVRLTAWKLRPGISPRGRVRMVSSNSESRYPKGTSVRLDVVSGHRDSFRTRCPGDALYDRLAEIRAAASRLRQWPAPG
ncbi:hypothetical protein GCM10028832_45130 [Streptomyces sparsus]